MGGDTISLPETSFRSENKFTMRKQQLAHRLSKKPNSRSGGLSFETAEDNNEFGEIAENEERMFTQVLESYDELDHRVANIEVAKTKVLSYTPGSWVENVGGKTMKDYNVPKTTTLLLIGPKGSGKSSLINKISRVFEDDKFAPERAQVTYNSGSANGTFFLQEYMIPRSSNSFCLYDTRSFSNDSSENLKMIKRWMTIGVSHGEPVKSALDSSSLQTEIKRKTSQHKPVCYERRTVNFVIFVVNGLSVLKCMDSYGADTQYTEMVTELFNSPLLSFRDHKPAIAITHGDLLSLSERARVRIYLGELLGVHPSKQTFDIPDDGEETTNLTLVDLVRYALEHADRNLPCKDLRVTFKDCIQPWKCLLTLLALAILIVAILVSPEAHGKSIPEPSIKIESIPEPDIKIDWKSIRHIW